MKKASLAVAAACMILVPAGCNTDVDGPRSSNQSLASSLRTRKPVGDLYSYVEPGGSVITVWDEWNGKGYTLDIPNKEIRTSDGEVLLLTDEQTAIAATAFQGTVESDPIVPSLQNLSGPDPCSPATGGCIESVTYGGGEILLRRADSDTSNMHRGGSSNFRITTPPGSVRIGSNQGNKNGQVVTASSSGDICTDVLNAALSGVDKYRDNRTRFVSEAIIGGIVEFINDKWVKILPVGSGLAANFALAAADHYYSRVAMGILAWTWNTYNCGNRAYTGSIVLGGNTVPSGTGAYVCYYTHWEISFNGGATWYPITVRVCEYQS